MSPTRMDGGRIGVASEAGEGATFIVELRVTT